MDVTDQKPIVRRKGRGARERILAAAAALFTAQGINSTGMEQLSAEAKVTKRTVYAHFASKEALVEEYLKQMDQFVRASETTLGDPGTSPRERLLSIFDAMLPASPESAGSAAAVRGCPFLNAAVEVPDPDHPAHAFTTAQKNDFAGRLADVAREAGVRDPEDLGKQLALLYDGAAARGVALNSVEPVAVARRIADLLLDAALPTSAQPNS